MAEITEQQAYETIDAMLAASGGAVQGYQAFGPSPSITFLEEASESNRIQVSFSDLARQTRIVAEVEQRLSVVEKLEATVTLDLQHATDLRQAVLKKVYIQI